MTKITISALAAAVSLAVFACTESPSSPSNSSNAACKFTGTQFGLGSALFICEEDKVSNLQESKEECIDLGGTFVDACPSGEKHTCISDEKGEENLITKIYANDVACGDLNLRNADGSESIVPKGGACDQIRMDNNLTCAEILDFPTFLVKIVCSSELNAPFAKECPDNAKLVCYMPPQNGDPAFIYHFYEGPLSNSSCSDLDLEDL